MSNNINNQHDAVSGVTMSSLCPNCDKGTINTLNNDSGDIDFFFNFNKNQNELRYSVLSVLVGDIEKCKKEGLIFPLVMCVMSGIDLLGKFYAGKDGRDRNDNVETRFKFFCEFIGVSDKNHRNTLFTLRNSIMHSYGFYDKKHLSNLPIFLSQAINKNNLVENINQKIIVNAIVLKDVFVKGVEKYRNELKNVDNKKLRENFRKMFNGYGRMTVELIPL